MISPVLMPASAAGLLSATSVTIARSAADSRDSERSGLSGAKILGAHSQPTAHHFAVFAQLVQDFFRQIDGDRETDADVAAGLAEDRAY